jgi:MinD-like ATPase involved in chromosome partitioning or flagellar assembly
LARVISIHSFRGGTGKSNLAANLAALLAARGLRVAVVDTDIQSPGIHILFGLRGITIEHTLNDYLWGRVAIEEAAIDVTDQVGAPIAGRVFLLPSSIRSGEIARVLREGYDARALTSGLRQLARALALDFLLIDTHPGLNEETLLSIALSHTLVVVMRPDEQDYEGSGVTIEVARALGVPRMLIVVNKSPAVYDPAGVAAQVEQSFLCTVAAVIPHSDEIMALASQGLFALHFPQHPIAAMVDRLAERLMSEEDSHERAHTA